MFGRKNLMTPKLLFNLTNYISEDKMIKFYKTKEWKEIRNHCIMRDKFECQHCKDIGGKSKADMVHHIKHVKISPSDALDSANCVSLCNSCHNIEHPEKFGNNTKKRKFTNDERW